MTWLKRRLARWLIDEIHAELSTRPAVGLIALPKSFAIIAGWDESTTNP